MLCQPLVDVRVIRIQQFDNAAVFTDDVVEQEFHFLAHRLPQRIVKVRINQWQWTCALQAAQVQPLTGKIGGKRCGSRILKHPANLVGKNRRLFQAALRRERDQLRIRARTPQEKRKARCQFNIADGIRNARLCCGRLCFRAVNKLESCQKAGHGSFDRIVKIAFFSSFLIEGRQLGHIGGRYRTPICL